MSGGGLPLEPSVVVGVVGAGAMGAGIAQVAAAAGHRVLLMDAQPGAAARGIARTAAGIDNLVARDRMERTTADALVARIEAVDALEDLAAAGLVVEAIVEDADAKRDLIGRLEAVLADDAVIATNTSSISITAVARDATQPGRIAGLHFFNPAPVMRLVEIVSGVATEPEVAARLHATASRWGKVPVHARSTPGFIVNRVARPYYAEALRLLEEGVADPTTIDALLVQGAGFRMGPFALMDLIGHDVNYAVSRSVFDAYYQDPRYRPSIVQKELVDAGRLGRKSGRGFYDHAPGSWTPEPSTMQVGGEVAPFTWHPDEPTIVDGVVVAPTDGRTARARARGGSPTIVHDLLIDDARRVAFATSPGIPEATVDRFVATLARRGIVATRLPDWPGLVALRTVAMLANEGFEAVMQGVASEADVDAAMRHGVNYPKGPIEWGRRIGLTRILATLDEIHAATGDPRYRASFALRLAADEADETSASPGGERADAEIASKLGMAD